MTTPKPDEPYRLILQAIARLETRVIEGTKDVAAIKGELRKIAPRLDTVSAEVHEAARLVHLQANIAQAAALAAADVAAALSLLEGRVRQLRDVTADEHAAAARLPPPPAAPKEVPTNKGD